MLRLSKVSGFAGAAASLLGSMVLMETTGQRENNNAMT